MSDLSHIGLWVGFIAGIVILLVLDLTVVHRKPHAVGVREAAIWTTAWIILGVLFGIGVWYFAGNKAALEYYTGYLLEKGLSVDNLFVFLVIFGAFAVPKELQHRVLFWGILGAIVMRGVFIGLGVALVNRFEWILYAFGVFLVVTGGRLLLGAESVDHPEQSRPIRWMRRVIPCTSDYRGSKFFVREGGRLVATPLLLVLATVEFTDVIFATDSIPAIFGVTRDPFIIFSSNVLAILGLRAMFFLLADMMDRFHYLHVGLALVLVFIGVKMLIEDWVHVPVPASLGIVAGALAISVVASLASGRRVGEETGETPRR